MFIDGNLLKRAEKIKSQLRLILFGISLILSINGVAQMRITGPADPKFRCADQPLDPVTCEEKRINAVNIGCITPIEQAELKKYGSAPACDPFIKPDKPKTDMLIGWCACGCFAPNTNIAVVRMLGGDLPTIFEKQAKSIRVQSPLKLVTLSEDASLGSLQKDYVDIRMTTVGAERKGLVKIVSEDKRVLYVTDKHPILTADGKMVLASNLRPTDKLVDLNGDHFGIISLSSIPYNGLVYNFVTESETKQGHVIFAEGFAVGDLYWQSSLEDEINQIFIRQ